MIDLIHKKTANDVFFDFGACCQFLKAHIKSLHYIAHFVQNCWFLDFVVVCAELLWLYFFIKSYERSEDSYIGLRYIRTFWV